LDNDLGKLAAQGSSGGWFAVAPDQSGIRHCRIVDENDSTDIKLISEKTLTDPSFYQLVEPTDEEAEDRSN
jgi:hypothetical protein